jgi:hypothetical protein
LNAVKKKGIEKLRGNGLGEGIDDDDDDGERIAKTFAKLRDPC